MITRFSNSNQYYRSNNFIEINKDAIELTYDTSKAENIDDV